MATKKRVLIVDDEEDIREGAGFWLNSQGFETLMAEDGLAGVESAQANTPDAILLDMLMPNQDGIQTLEKLRSSEETAGIPVVMLSASLRDQQRALDAGARFFLNKPYEGPKLISAMNAAIEQVQPS